MTKNYNTFIELIENINIEIPMIQRDYAQGRDDTKNNELRKNFVAKLLSTIDNSEKLELDFIYGPVQNGTFIPVDGQQRLTTLLLLHWYLAKRANVEIDLQKFTYKVRTTTQEFLNELFASGIEIKEDLKSFKNEILDAKWYYSMWNYDPSVQGMINMLDEIHNQYKSDYEDKELWSKLIKNKPIKFHMLNMADYKLSEELYLKMNARGLPLSDFENFKAWLQGYCSEEKYSDDKYFSNNHNENWAYKVDKEWTDLFWDLAESDDKKFDKYFMNFFNKMAIFGMIESSDCKLENIEEIYNNVKNDKYISFSFYKESKCFSIGHLKNIFKFLDLLGKSEYIRNANVGFNEDSIVFDKFIGKKDEKKPYKNLVLQYAIFKYIMKFGFKENDDNFADWIRVVRNLVENTDIGLNNFQNILSKMNEMISVCENDILNSLKSNKIEIKFFNEDQIKEEILKAKLILSGDDEWKALIIKAEKHGLFKGQINFLLKKFDSKSKLTELNKDDIDKFKDYWEKAQQLWCIEGKQNEKDKNENFLLLRAILAQDIFIDYKNINNFHDWKVILKESGANKAIINLFNSTNHNNLQKIIDDYKYNGDLHTYYSLIKNGHILKENHFVAEWHEIQLLSLKKSSRAIGWSRNYIAKNRDDIYAKILGQCSNFEIAEDDKVINIDNKKLLTHQLHYLKINIEADNILELEFSPNEVRVLIKAEIFGKNFDHLSKSLNYDDIKKTIEFNDREYYLYQDVLEENQLKFNLFDFWHNEYQEDIINKLIVVLKN